MAASNQDQNLGQLASATQIQAEQEQFRANNNLPAASGKNLAADVIRTSGNSMTGPNVQPANMTNQERAMARANGAMVNAYKPDTNKYNKLTSFNASHHGRNFDRYYSHPKFKELGFSPWRDNEAFYNKNSSLWDDAIRGHLAGTKLMGLGFTSTFTNWGSLFSLKPNTEEADEMERLMSIGSSSREGFGAKVVNFGVNAGYTFGTVSEIIAEELALAGATVLTGGLAAPVLGVRTAMNFGRLGKAAKGLYDTFKLATKIDNARQIWNASKGLKTLGKIGEAIMPFQNTVSTVRKGLKAGDTIGDMAKSAKTFGAFYRDLREINAVTSEAKLEGGTTQNDVTNRIYAEFRTNKKRDPNEQEAQLIFNQAREAGYLSSQMNAAGIYVSNKIVLNRLLKGVPGMGVLDKVARRKAKGTILFDANWAKLGKNPYEVVKGMKKFGKAAYYKQTFNPKNLAKGGLGYLSANLMEGVQEVYQEAIAKGISDYYVNTYNQPSRASSAEFYTKMKEGFKSQYSAQGLETFFSGFLMAGPISGAQTALFKGFDYARLAKLKNQSKAFAADPKNEGKENPFDKQLKEEEEYTAKVVNSLNDITKEPKKYFSALEQNIKVQADLARLGEQAALDGDTMAVKNTQDESLINHMITLLDAGKFDIFQDQLKGLQELDKADLQEAFDEDPNTTGKTVSDRISKVLERTNQIKDTYDKYSTIENQYDLRKDPFGYMAFEQARNIAIRNDVTFQRQGERIAGIMNEFSSNLPFENARASDFTVLFSIGDPGNPNFLQATGMRREVALLEQEILNLKQGTPEQQEQAKRLEEKKTSLQSLSSLTQAFNAAYTVTQSVGITAEEFETKNSDFEEVEGKFKKAFFDHIKLLAKETGKPVLDSQIEKSYEEFSDYWKLTSDREGTAAAINMLNTPAMFRESTERIKGAMEEANQRREENLKKALSEYKLKFLKNAFFNDLFEQFNAFVDPDEAQAYVDNQTIPTTFINADTLEFIKPTDSEYSGIMGLVDKYDELYFEETGNRLTRPIVGSAGVARFAGRSAEGEVVDQIYTRRDPSDKRTIKDLGTEFGFAHLQNMSEVDAVAVLTAIMKSANGFVPAAQKKLAQALLKLVKPGTKITFKNNHFTNSSYDPSNGIIVDARFSSEGFVGGTVPMEFSILNAVMQQVVTESLATDTAFNDNITALREQTKAVIGETENMLPYYAYALANNQQFVAEVMTNPEFKGIMGQIPFEGEMTEQTEEAKSLWGSFVDSVYKLIEKLFGLQRGKTLYQEALNVITNKLSQPGMGSATPETVTEEETAPVEEVTDPELEQLLKSKFNEIIDALTPEERLGISYDSWKQSDSTALGIIRKYKADKVRKAAATKSEDEDKIMTLAEKKKRFTSLGYTIVEMNTIPEDQVTDIIAKGIKKTITIDVVENGKTVSKEVPFDQLVKFGDHVERSIDDAIRTLGAKRMKLNADESAYVQYDALDQEIPGTEHERVTNVVKDPFQGADEAKQRGNIIDGLLRDFLLNKLTDINQFVEQYNKYKAANPKADLFGPTMLEELYDKMRTISLVIKQKGLKIKSDVPTLAGKIGSRKAAGTIDLLAYDGKGRVFIIDLKTSSQDRRLQYKLEETLEREFGKDYKIVKEAIKGHKNNIYAAIDTLSEPLKSKLKEISQRPEFAEAIKPKGMFVYFYKEADSLQQNAYRELLKQETGLVADQLIIFPLLTTKTRRTYTSVSFQKEGDTHTLRIPIIDIHKRLGVDNEVLNYPDNPLSPENLTEFTEEPVTSTPSSNIETKKTELRKKIESLPDDMIYGTHVTEDGVAKNIFDTQFVFSLGTALQGTVGLTNKQGLLDLMNNLLDGKSPHRNQFGVFILAFPKSEFGTPSAERKVNLDTIENDMMDNYPEFLGGKIPTKFNFGYFKDGQLVTKNDAEAPTPDSVGTDAIKAIETRRQEELEAYKLKKDGTPKNENELTKVYAIEDVKDINAKYDAELVDEYRKQEIAEFRNDVENAESFIVNGRIDSKKVKASSNAKAKEIYDRYDKLITPLLPAAKPAPAVDAAQQKTLFKAFEKAFYEGNDKRYDDISDETLAKLSPATRQYLLSLYETLKPFNSTFQRMGKILDKQTSKEITTEDQKIKYVTSSYFGGLGRGSSELGSPANPKHKDLVLPVPTADVLTNINEVFGAKLTDAELAASEPVVPVTDKKAVVEVISENYTPELLKANPDKLFLFGDNNTRTGKGGQAIIRDEPNAVGISTKLLPKNTPEAFMSDDQLADNKAVIDSDIKKAKEKAAKEGKTIVLPKGGFGTGLAALATKAPQTFAYLNQRLQEEFGFNNTTGELTATTPSIDAKKADIERRRQEELASIISEAVLDDIGYRSTLGFKVSGWSVQEVKDTINAKYDAELAALEGKPAGTGLDVDTTEVESEVADKFKGKIIYTTPTNESIKKLNNIPGLVYGSNIYATVVLGAITEEMLQKIQTIADDKTLKPKVNEAAQNILNFAKNGINADQVKDLNYALAVLSDSSNYKDARLGTLIKSVRQNAWKQTMGKAREVANSGKTVVFDNLDAARSPEIDIALIDANSDIAMTDSGKSNMLKAEGQISKAKTRVISGKGLVNVLKGSISEEYYVSSDITNFKNALSVATRNTLTSMDIELRNLATLGVLESILAKQGLTIEEARSLFAQKKAELKNKVDISDLVVDPNNPTIVTYISGEDMSTGVVILNDGMTVTIAKYSGNETFNDLLNNAEHTTFTAGSVPNVIVPSKAQAAVSVDISVKNQSDNIMNDAKDNMPSSADTLKKAIEANKNKSVSAVVNEFISIINCKKKTSNDL